MSGHHLVGKEERDALNKIFDEQGGVLFAHGFDVRRNHVFLVKETENYLASTTLNCKYVSLVSSGTAALKIACKAVGVQPNTKVITQAFNFIAVAEVIHDLGCEIIFCESDETLNMCPIALEKLIEENNDISAVIPVSMLGNIPDLKKMRKICRSKEVPLILDGCESLGSTIYGRDPTAFCDICVYSFDFGKTITCGEGGALATNSIKFKKYSDSYRDHGHALTVKARNLDPAVFPGFNFRITEMQAAVLGEQAKKLPIILSKQKSLFDNFCRPGGIVSKYLRPEVSTHIHQQDNVFLVNLSSDQVKRILKVLHGSGMGTKNVPDAIRWHCAYYWEHIEPKVKEDAAVLRTLTALKNSVCINIDISRCESVYKTLGIDIEQALESRL